MQRLNLPSRIKFAAENQARSFTWGIAAVVDDERWQTIQHAQLKMQSDAPVPAKLSEKANDFIPTDNRLERCEELTAAITDCADITG
jgi:hypothetical protein